MNIKTMISFKEYVKLLYTITYKKPIMILLVLIDLVTFLWVISYNFELLTIPKPSYYQYLTLILITIVQPFVIFTTIRANYNSSSHLREPLEIEFTRDEVKVKGDSFYMELKWIKIFKVLELKNWYLIYQNNLSAIIIPKKSFQNDQEEKLREMVRSIAVVPCYLRSK
jgi:hypothetical protein